MPFESKKQRPQRVPVLESRFEDEFEFGPSDDRSKNLADELLEKYLEAPIRGKAKAQYHWRRQLIVATYKDIEAKEIPVEDLKIIAEYSSDDFMNNRYAKRVRSPLTGVRAFCVNCMGGTPSYVRDCTNIICPLFPFRMGNNPFYGRVENADMEASEDFPDEE